MKLHFSVLMAFLAFTLTISRAPAAEADDEKAAAEKMLKEAGVATDGPGLLEYFRKQTLTEQQEQDLKDAVRQLGHNEFETRERATMKLIQAGRLAIPFLKPALKDNDAEIVRRAGVALEQIQETPIISLMSAAALVLTERRPPEAAAVLLAYLPNAADESIEEAVMNAIIAVGLRNGKPEPAVTRALADKDRLRRAAAAAVLGRCPLREDRQPAVKLLADAEPRVRFEAADALLRSGDKTAMPPFIALLKEAPLVLAWQTEDILARLAEDQLPPAALGSGKDQERAKCREAWDAWWKANQAKVDITKIKNEQPLRGLTVVTEFDGDQAGGRVWEFGPDGKMRWEIKNLSGPNDAQVLPGGRVLIAERNGNRVTERDRDGKILWEYQNSTSPIAAQRLPNGNTLIATFTQLLEVSPDKTVVHTHNHVSGFRHALRLRNGNILYIASNGEIGELDAQFKPVRTITPEAHGAGASYWASIEPLPNGRFLIALGTSSKVLEVDGNGKIQWQLDTPNPVFASRLRNGNTLVSQFDNKLLIEFDRNGKEVSRMTLAGRPFTFKRY